MKKDIILAKKFEIRICIIALSLILFPFVMYGAVQNADYYLGADKVCITNKVAPTGDVYSHISWDNSTLPSLQEGSPELPYEILSIQVPKNSRNFRVSVNIKPENIETVKLEHRLYPVQTELTTNDNPNDYSFIVPSTSLYNEASPFKAEILSDGFLFGDNHRVTIGIWPVSYSDGNKILSIIKSLTINLEYESCMESDLKDFPITPISMNKISSNQNTFVTTDTSMSASSMGGTISNSDFKYYYIIVPESLEDGVNDLVVWKKQKGYDVIKVTVEDILANPDYLVGSKNKITEELIVDEAASVRAYLQKQYQEHGTFFCLLVGDYRTSMPIRKLRKTNNTQYFSEINGSQYIPTDNYFSDLTTKWNLTNTYSEVYTDQDIKIGYYPDIYIGRLLCSSNFELDNYFAKLRQYESNPGNGDNEYLNTYFFFEQDHKKDSVPNGLLGLSNGIIEKLPSDINVVLLRDSCYTKGAFSLPHTGSDVIKNMRRSGFNSWFGHGSPSVINTCSWRYSIIPQNNYTNPQLNWSSTNPDFERGIDCMDNDSYPSIVYTISCTVMPFDCYTEYEADSYHVYDIPYNFGSAFTVAGKYGGPAFIGNTRVGWSSGSTTLEKNFFDEITQTHKVGVAQALSKHEYYHTHVRAACNLIGDPEFEMWLKRPHKFVFNQVNTQQLDFTSSDLLDAEYIVYNGSETIYRSLLNGDIPNAPTQFNNYLPLISIWKSGYLPSIRLYAQEGHITNVNAKYFPHEAYFGNNSAGISSKKCVIGSNAFIDIDVMKAVNINDGFTVGNGGKVNIQCHEEISVSGDLLESGGEAVLSGRLVILEPGFKVKTGGKFTVATQ